MRIPLLALLGALVSAPIGILLLHIAIHRLVSIGGRRVTGHASGMRAIALGFVIVLAVASQLGVLRWGFDGLAQWVAGLAYVSIVYGAMALLYVNAINIAETSLTAHTLLEISWAGELSDAALYSKYNADHMVRVRMDRLTSLGQIRAEHQTYVLTGRWLLRFAQAVDVWRRIVGVPAPILLRQGATK